MDPNEIDRVWFGVAKLLGICVRTDAQLEKLVDGGALFAAMATGGLMILHSTVAPDLARRLAAMAKESGGLIDVGVSGGGPAAIEGKLSLFVGGDEAAVERARPWLQSIGKSVAYPGPVGHGLEGKILNNLISIANYGMSAAIVDVDARLGFDIEMLTDALMAGSAQSFALKVSPGWVEKSEMNTSSRLLDLHDLLKKVVDHARNLLPAGDPAPACSADRPERYAGTLDMLLTIIARRPRPVRRNWIVALALGVVSWNGGALESQILPQVSAQYPQSVPPLPDEPPILPRLAHVFSHSTIAAKLLADARSGQALAQYRVGGTFITQGPNDVASALYWYRKAAAQGYEPAGEKVSRYEHSEEYASLQRAKAAERTAIQNQVTADTAVRAAAEQKQNELADMQLIEQIRAAGDARSLRCTDNEGIVSLLTISERSKGLVAEKIAPAHATAVFVDARRVTAPEKVTAYVVHFTPYEISVFVTSSPGDARDGDFSLDRNTLYLTTEAPTTMLGFALAPSDRLECTATQPRHQPP